MTIPSGIPGPQVLLNPSFDPPDGIIEGSELAPNSFMNGTGGSSAGTGTVVGDIADNYTVSAGTGLTLTCSKTAIDSQKIVASGAGIGNISDLSYNTSVTGGKIYKAKIRITGLVGAVSWIIRNDTNSWNVTAGTIDRNAIYTYIFEAPTDMNIASRISFDDSEEVEINEISIKEITLDDWEFLGTQTATNYIDFGVQNLRFFCDGSSLGITQGIPTGFDYKYTVKCNSYTGGAVSLFDGGSRITQISSLGETSGFFTASNSSFNVLADGGTDLTLDYVYLNKMVRSKRAIQSVPISRTKIAPIFECPSSNGTNIPTVPGRRNNMYVISFDFDSLGADAGFVVIQKNNSSGKWPHAAGASNRIHLQDIQIHSNQPPDGLADLRVGFLKTIGASSSSIMTLAAWNRSLRSPFGFVDILNTSLGGGFMEATTFGNTYVTDNIVSGTPIKGPDGATYTAQVGDLVVDYEQYTKNSEFCMVFIYDILT